ncbi:Diphthamide synthase [Pseudomonas syringae pv. actinidiae]|uniref:Diphthamide synthase n=1 Tax=Pseudomonas syringae pv. actinidiae TaxID=103796 RepID=A0A2V0QFL2_PSESF|nr:Diphthamide synthase [Pseudomonas syringae pv. actinidiae]GBH16142.1 Diphthamide synthase [Pseudomonas syringae pv. actinidiae]
MRQLCSRSARILGNNLLQYAFDLVGMTQTTLDISQLVQRVRHLGMLGILLADFGERLTSTLKVAFGQIHLAQPILGIARV